MLFASLGKSLSSFLELLSQLGASRSNFCVFLASDLEFVFGFGLETLELGAELFRQTAVLLNEVLSLIDFFLQALDLFSTFLEIGFEVSAVLFAGPVGSLELLVQTERSRALDMAVSDAGVVHGVVQMDDRLGIVVFGLDFNVAVGQSSHFVDVHHIIRVYETGFCSVGGAAIASSMTFHLRADTAEELVHT